MDAVNSNYGQDFVYALWAGVGTPPPPIWGHVQHSWMPDSPFLVDAPHSRHWPLFVYSERNRQEAEKSGFGRVQPVIAVGSPFLYLHVLLAGGRLGASDVPLSASTSTIFYPRHADGRDDMLDHAGDLQVHLRARYGSDITVCLHFNDYSNARIRQSYRDAGFRVVCHGWGGDPQFLVVQYAELLRHGRAASNMVTTPLWHAAALGLQVEVTGPELNEPTDPENYSSEQPERWPAFYSGGMGGREAVELARAELGWSCMREPGELAHLFGWQGLRRVRTRALEMPVRIRRRLQDYEGARIRGRWA